MATSSTSTCQRPRSTSSDLTEVISLKFCTAPISSTGNPEHFMSRYEQSKDHRFRTRVGPQISTNLIWYQRTPGTLGRLIRRLWGALFWVQPWTRLWRCVETPRKQSQAIDWIFQIPSNQLCLVKQSKFTAVFQKYTNHGPMSHNNQKVVTIIPNTIQPTMFTKRAKKPTSLVKEQDN